MGEREAEDLGEDRSLLIVDDDEPFLRRLARAMEKRGFEPELAQSVAAGQAIATAVAAVKIGATDYLSKPADANDITAALLAESEEMPPPPENPMSADRVRWEHIQRVYELCDRNVSETARRLNMHRRTLQRILAKRSPR
jgi:two-component system response regulator RegA